MRMSTDEEKLWNETFYLLLKKTMELGDVDLAVTQAARGAHGAVIARKTATPHSRDPIRMKEEVKR